MMKDGIPADTSLQSQRRVANPGQIRPATVETNGDLLQLRRLFQELAASGNKADDAGRSSTTILDI
jgi:hypothetical protein